MSRKLFCELGPWAYRLSSMKCCMARRILDAQGRERFVAKRSEEPLPVLIYRHNSLIRRRLGQVDMTLQENKAVNLSLAAPYVSDTLIYPGETLSFWRLVGNPSARRGFREGLTVGNGAIGRGVGGGMCQFTNLLHWLALHSDLTIAEHHHHDGYDLFPDFGRQVPFGVGTSIVYNYLDYRLRNDTGRTYQLLTWVDGKYLRGELRADLPQSVKYHLRTEDERFVEEDGVVYRLGRVWREQTDLTTGDTVARELLRENHARVMYDTTGLEILHR